MGEAGISPGFPYFMASSLTFVFPTRPAFFNALCIFLAGQCGLLCMINFIPIFMLVTIGQSASCRHCPTSPAEGHEDVRRNKLALLSQKSLTPNVPCLWSSKLCHTPCKAFLLDWFITPHTQTWVCELFYFIIRKNPYFYGISVMLITMIKNRWKLSPS